MNTPAARSLPAAAQEALRYRAVEAVRQGMAKAEAARVFGVSRQTVIRTWAGSGRRRGAKTLGRVSMQKMLVFEGRFC